MTTTTPRSYKVGCKTSGDRNWAYNALRFATEAEAAAYGADLFSRGLALREYEVHPSDDEPTDTWPRSR